MLVHAVSPGIGIAGAHI